MRSVLYYSIALGIFSGCITAMLVPKNLWAQYWWVFFMGISVWIFWSRKLFPEKFVFWTVFCISCGFVLGIARVDQFHKRFPFDALNDYHNQTIILIGTVDNVPHLKPGQQQLIIRPEFINGEPFPKKTVRIMIRYSDLEKFSYGDRLVIQGKFSLRSNFVSDTNRNVPYQLMSYSKKIVGDIGYPTITEHAHSNESFWNFFATIKQHFIESLHALFYSPTSGLLAGIMIGDTSTLDNSFLDIFRSVGLIHIVVLSGYNITLIANFFVRLFARLGYHRRLVFAMIALTLFILIVGISQTALRAGIMALCAFSAQYFIRPYMILRGMVMALAIMTLVSPYSLLFDLSLQLSFLATIGIVFLFPLLQEKIPRISKSFFGEILVQTIAVNILTLPLIIYQIGYFSFISFPINVIVLGGISLITIGGFVTVLIGMIFFPLGQILALPLQLITDSIIALASFASRHDPFSIQFPQFSIYWIIGIYICIFLLMIRASLQRDTVDISA